ncbi:MAG: potassium channel family protein [Archaeoglobaceae archaeon]
MRLNETVAILLTIASILTIIAVELTSGEIQFVLVFLDLVFTLVLISDFVSRSREGGKRYLLMNFYEIFAYIPAIVLFYFVPPHLAVIFRGLRVLRIIALGIKLMREMRAKSAKLLSYAMLMLFITILLGSTSFYIAEGKARDLHFFDCVYWAVVTITTIGYGDIVPMTPLGKIISMMIVLFGVSIVSIFTASILSAVISEEELGLKEEIEKLIKKHEKRTMDDNEKKLLLELKKLLES